MTASAELRRRYTTWTAAGTAVALVVVVVFAFIGARTLASSTIGGVVETPAERPVVELPFTSTAFVGVTDTAGELVSAAVVVLSPDGVGGAVVPLSVDADVSSGAVPITRTLRDSASVSDDMLFEIDVESLTNISFDLVAVLTRAEFASLLSAGGTEATVLAASLAAAGDGDVAASYSLTVSAWSEFADAVDGGVPALADVFADSPLSDDAVPASIESFLRRLLAGSIGVRGLRASELLAPDVDGNGAVLTFDPAEMTVVMAHIAPRRVAAPTANATVRVEVPFDDVNGTSSPTASDLAVIAVRRLTVAGLNVVSVSTSVDSASRPERTTIAVNDPDQVETAATSFSELFGNVTATLNPTDIAGVDIVVTLGDSFLDDFERVLPADLTYWSSST